VANKQINQTGEATRFALSTWVCERPRPAGYSHRYARYAKSKAKSWKQNWI